MADLALQQAGQRFGVITLIGGTSAQAEDLSETLINVVVRHYLISDVDHLVDNVDEYLSVRTSTGSVIQNKVAFTITPTSVT